MVPLPLPIWDSMGIILPYLLWEPGAAPGGKCHKIAEPPLCLASLGRFNSPEFSMPSLQQFINHRPGLPAQVLGPALVWIVLMKMKKIY